MKTRHIIFLAVAFIAFLGTGIHELNKISYDYFNDVQYIDNSRMHQTIMDIDDDLIEDYYEEGQLRSIANMRDGKLHGEVIFYYRDGQVEIHRNYRDGKQQGEELAYFPDGTLRHRRNFRDNKECGLQKYYNHKGEIVESYNVINGIVKDHEYFNDSLNMNQVF